MTGAPWLLRRLGASAGIIFAVVTFIFVLVHLAPGKPCGGQNEFVDPRACDDINRQQGLDKSILEQYRRYLVALAHGDLGYSSSLKRPVREAIAETIPFTLQLAGASLFLDFLLGLALGIYQAMRFNRLPHLLLGNITLFVYSLPTFWLALLLLLLFGQKLAWFPVGGASDPIFCPVVDSLYCLADRFWHLILPAATLGVVGAAGTARFQRAALLDLANPDYIPPPPATGVPQRRLVLRPPLRDALLSF